MPDEFSSLTKRLVADMTEAIETFGKKNLGREFKKDDLDQMTTSLEETARELLWFGFDKWPADTTGSESIVLSD